MGLLLSPIINRVIHKSLRDFRPLRYSGRDGHAEGEHVNRGRDTPVFCPTLQVLDMSTLGHTADVNPAIITGLTSAVSSKVDISNTCKVGQKIGVSLPLLTCSPSAWPSWLLYRRGRKTRRDLWITLYKCLLNVLRPVSRPITTLDFLLLKNNNRPPCSQARARNQFSSLSLRTTGNTQQYPMQVNTIRYSVTSVLSGFRREVDENCALLGYYAASSGKFLPTFRGNLSVPSSGLNQLQSFIRTFSSLIQTSDSCQVKLKQTYYIWALA